MHSGYDPNARRRSSKIRRQGEAAEGLSGRGFRPASGLHRQQRQARQRHPITVQRPKLVALQRISHLHLRQCGGVSSNFRRIRVRIEARCRFAQRQSASMAMLRSRCNRERTCSSRMLVLVPRRSCVLRTVFSIRMFSVAASHAPFIESLPKARTSLVKRCA